MKKTKILGVAVIIIGIALIIIGTAFTMFYNSKQRNQKIEEQQNNKIKKYYWNGIEYTNIVFTEKNKKKFFQVTAANKRGNVNFAHQVTITFFDKNKEKIGETLCDIPELQVNESRELIFEYKEKSISDAESIKVEPATISIACD